MKRFAVASRRLGVGLQLSIASDLWWRHDSRGWQMFHIFGATYEKRDDLRCLNLYLLGLNVKFGREVRSS